MTLRILITFFALSFGIQNLYAANQKIFLFSIRNLMEKNSTLSTVTLSGGFIGYYYDSIAQDIVLIGQSRTIESQFSPFDIAHLMKNVINGAESPYCMILPSEKDKENFVQLTTNFYRDREIALNKKAMLWERNADSSIVVVDRNEEYSHITKTLFEIDFLLKRFLVGQERIRRIDSYKNFVEQRMSSQLQKGIVSDYPSAPLFWLSIPTIKYSINSSMCLLQSSQLQMSVDGQAFVHNNIRVMPKDGDETHHYSSYFNQNMDRLKSNKPSFQYLEDLIHLFALLKICARAEKLDFFESFTWFGHYFGKQHNIPKKVPTKYCSFFADGPSNLTPTSTSMRWFTILYVFTYGGIDFKSTLNIDNLPSATADKISQTIALAITKNHSQKQYYWYPDLSDDDINEIVKSSQQHDN